jgi:hypothetical protein
MKGLFAIVVVAVLGFSMPTVAGAKDNEGPCVPVYVVTTTEGGFTNPNKDVANSTKDLINSLKGKKALCVVDKKEGAAIVLEVLGREKAQMTASWAGSARDCTVAVKFTFGDFETTLTASAQGGTISSGGAWSKAAGKVASQVEDWVKANRDKIDAARK